MKMSQSLMKSLFDFRFGEKCGLQIYASYVDGVEFKSTLPMDIGNWFEYKCTGALPRTGRVPIPKMSYEGTKRETLSAPYKKMLKHIDTYHATMAKMGFEVITAGHVFTSEKASGIADLIVNHKGEKAIIDIKTTALLNDKWSETGWHIDRLTEKEKLMIQVLQYKVLAREEFGINNIPFFFMIFSTTNENDARLIEIEVDDYTLDNHERAIEDATRYFEDFKKLPPEELARPELKECANCVLFETCAHATKSITPVKLQY